VYGDIWMKIYLDVIFFINFFFDFILLFATKYILKEQVKFFRLFLGSLLGTFSILFLFLKITSFQLFILKIMISMLMILVTFGKKNFYKNYLYFYIISIFLGGFVYLLNVSFSYQNKGILFFSNGLSINFLLILILSPIVVYFYLKEMKSYKNNISNIFLVDIVIGKKKYQLRGYLDTGNTLEDPYQKRSVILLDLKKIKLNKEKFIYVPYQTINETGVIKCYQADSVVINQKEFKNILIGDIKNKFHLENSDCILPNKMKEDLC